MIIILFGVSGCGKTVVGRALAQMLGWEFIDGDDYHPKENVEKMKRGISLDDRDRLPWLIKLAKIEQERISAGKNAILACSALKKSYREILTIDPDICLFVYLKVTKKVVKKRMHQRGGHFMHPALLESQFDTLEKPEEGVIVNGDANISEVVKEILSKLCL
jgi:gluconokinase